LFTFALANTKSKNTHFFEQPKRRGSKMDGKAPNYRFHLHNTVFQQHLQGRGTESQDRKEERRDKVAQYAIF